MALRPTAKSDGEQLFGMIGPGGGGGGLGAGGGLGGGGLGGGGGRLGGGGLGGNVRFCGGGEGGEGVWLSHPAGTTAAALEFAALADDGGAPMGVVGEPAFRMAPAFPLTWK